MANLWRIAPTNILTEESLVKTVAGTNVSTLVVNEFFGVTSGVTGTVSTTNQNDTSSAAGTPVITGTSAATNLNDTSSVTAFTTITGSATPVNLNDTCAATAFSVISGTSAAINNDDIGLASGGVVISGTVAATNADDTSNASGGLVITGSVAAVNQDDIGFATGLSGRFDAISFILSFKQPTTRYNIKVKRLHFNLIVPTTQLMLNEKQIKFRKYTFPTIIISVREQ